MSEFGEGVERCCVVRFAQFLAFLEREICDYVGLTPPPFDPTAVIVNCRIFKCDPNDPVLIVAFGAGLSRGGALVEWQAGVFAAQA
jgi:hypothetical protein